MDYSQNVLLLFALIFGVVMVAITYHFLGKKSRYTEPTRVVAFVIIMSLMIVIALNARKDRSQSKELHMQ